VSLTIVCLRQMHRIYLVQNFAKSQTIATIFLFLPQTKKPAMDKQAFSLSERKFRCI
jgi:hypothetical protein